MKPSLFVAIDPGASGAYVLRRPGGAISGVVPYRDDETVLKLCRTLGQSNISTFPIVAVIERVWASPVMGVASAFSFGSNYGGWVMALKASGITVFGPTPQQWQRSILPEGFEGQGTTRKAALKARAKELFPDWKPTLATSDALLLSEYVLRRLDKGLDLGERL